MPQQATQVGDLKAEYDAALQGAAVFDVSDRGKVQVAGKDAAGFLHNLSSNDILHLAPGRGCEAFFLNAKARVISHAWIYRVPDAGGESFWLDVAPGQAEALVRHLDHFLISEQVELLDRTADFSQFHVAGPRSHQMLPQALGGSFPELQPLQVVVQEVNALGPCQVRRHDPLGLPGYDLLLSTTTAPGLWERLQKAGASPAGATTYEVLRVEAGTPLLGRDIDESHLAMEAGRTPQAISFSKGCYLGQEPVVRSRDLGHVNRALLGLRVAGSLPVRPGAKVFQGANEVGVVTSAVVSPPTGETRALAYLRRGSQEPGTPLDVETEAGRGPAEVASLPFGR